MIAYLKGKLASKNPGHVIIECNGVGYFVRISLNTYDKLGKEESVKLHTHLSIKEDSHDLYGFFEEAEKELFLQLISISGVGGNTALTILSSTPPKDLQNAIEREDVDMLKRIKGIGPKTAGRIILELKGKLKISSADGGKTSIGSPLKNEAMSALLSLGFPRNEVEKRVEQIIVQGGDTLTLEEVIRKALKGN
jgi:holliday junction DNA helicase RuvA